MASEEGVHPGATFAKVLDWLEFAGKVPPREIPILTARSRTSGGNLFDFFMASSSQELKPPQNLGRFKIASEPATHSHHQNQIR